MRSTETEGPLLRQANLISNFRILGLLLKNIYIYIFFLSLEEARKRPVWFGKQGGRLDLSTRELQRDDKVAGFLGWVGRAVRKPGFESVASFAVRVGQR